VSLLASFHIAGPFCGTRWFRDFKKRWLELLASADEWMGPVQAEVMDGALVSDWYNFIIQYITLPQKVSLKTARVPINPLRDRTYGLDIPHSFGPKHPHNKTG